MKTKNFFKNLINGYYEVIETIKKDMNEDNLEEAKKAIDAINVMIEDYKNPIKQKMYKVHLENKCS